MINLSSLYQTMMCAERRLFWDDILALVFPQGTVIITCFVVDRLHWLVGLRIADDRRCTQATYLANELELLMGERNTSIYGVKNARCLRGSIDD